MQRTTNYQDLFLNQFRRDHQNVTVFLVNGFQIKGVVRAFDNFTVVMEADGRQQLIYKHAISTIIPVRPVPLPVEAHAPQEEAARPVG
jgi:host factor-I protein